MSNFVEVELSETTPGAFIYQRPDGTILKGTGDYASMVFAIELLKELEWGPSWGHVDGSFEPYICPVCEGQEPVGRWKHKYGHKPDCKLDLFLRKYA